MIRGLTMDAARLGSSFTSWHGRVVGPAIGIILIESSSTLITIRSLTLIAAYQDWTVDDAKQISPAFVPVV